MQLALSFREDMSRKDYDKERSKTRNKDPKYKEQLAISFIARTYNVDKENAKALYLKSMQQCEICKIEWDPEIHAYRFCVDHCHTTGKVRGVLCFRCNVELGFYETSKKKFDLFSKYLNEIN
jgi:hypothetical protein